MIGRLRGRANFGRIARSGLRVRAGALWCTFVLDPFLPAPHVGYAIGRSVGPAVTRNLIRRRLRALIRDRSTGLAPGLYLIGARPEAAGLSFIELTFEIDRLIQRVSAKASSFERPTKA